MAGCARPAGRAPEGRSPPQLADRVRSGHRQRQRECPRRRLQGDRPRRFDAMPATKRRPSRERRAARGARGPDQVGSRTPLRQRARAAARLSCRVRLERIPCGQLPRSGGMRQGRAPAMGRRLLPKRPLLARRSPISCERLVRCLLASNSLGPDRQRLGRLPPGQQHRLPRRHRRHPRVGVKPGRRSPKGRMTTRPGTMKQNRPTKAHQGAEGEVVTTSILFTDIVSSTEQAARMGHRRWTKLTTAHDAVVPGRFCNGIEGERSRPLETDFSRYSMPPPELCAPAWT